MRDQSIVHTDTGAADAESGFSFSETCDMCRIRPELM